MEEKAEPRPDLQDELLMLNPVQPSINQGLPNDAHVSVKEISFIPHCIAAYLVA